MAKNLLGALLLFSLTAATAHAQSVTLRACNPGKTDVDVYFAQGGHVVSQHVAPTYCAKLAFSEGAMAPGLVAVGFANLRGQWGGVHRYESVPNFGPRVAQAATQTLSVMHGATTVSIPAQFRFEPPTPKCVTYRGAQSTNPMVKTAEYTRCDEFVYDVNVLAFPDTREVAFQSFCQPCDDQAEARKTPELRAAEKQIADLKRAAVDNLPMSIRVPLERDTKQQAVNRSEEPKDRYRESLERDPTKWDHIGWSDVPRYASAVASLSAPNVAMLGSVAVLQGTLSSIQRHNASDPWFDVFFQESPDHKFILCTKDPDVLSDIFGANYATAMVGKKIEVEGKVVGCLGGRPGILLKLTHQIKLVGTGAGMVASVTPPAFKFPDDPNRPPPPASAEATAAAAAAAAAYEVSASGVAARAAKEAPNAQSTRGGTSLMPFYNPYRDAVLFQIGMYCGSIYRLANNADWQRCAAEVDFDELVSNRKVALRYCFVNNNYIGAGNAGRLKTFDECMNQNDELTALCTRELVHSKGPGLQCSLDHPLDREAALLLKGTDENGTPLVSAATAPGLPASMKTLWAARDRAVSAGGTNGSAAVVAPAPVAATAPAQAVTKPAPAAPAAPANPAVARAQKTQACVAETMQRLGPNALRDLAAYQKSIQDCMQR